MSFPNFSIGSLKVKLPIVQGGMGVGISLAGLASAVASQGGIGVIAGAMIGMREPDIVSNPIEANVRALGNEIRKAKEQVVGNNGAIGVNIMVALTTFTQMVREAIECGADVIFAGAGLPLDMPKNLLELCEEKKREFSTKLVPIVSSARAAAIIAKKWLNRFDYLPDAFVLEGPKAGGHLGFKKEEIDDPNYALEKILPDLLSTTKKLEDEHGKAIPVIAGGGVYSGADIYKLLSMGAEAVQMGTRFVATDECDADIAFKQAYISAKNDDATIINSPVGLPGRAIYNKFIEQARQGLRKPVKCIFHCIHTCNPATTPYCIAQTLINATKGKLDGGFAFCGANVGKVNQIIPVKELIATLEKEYEVAKEYQEDKA